MSFYKDKVVFITGASSGIGRELALQLASAGAKLILTARSLPALLLAKEDCERRGADCKIFPADLLIQDERSSLVISVLQAFGKVDIYISNAGVSQRSFAMETSLEIDRQLMEINFFASIDLAKSLLSHFKEQGSGQIIVISSMAGLMGFPQRTAYAAAKHALMGYYETLQVEHNLPKFYITIVSPGRIQTGISIASLTADGSLHGKMDKGQQNGIPASICAAKILTAAAKRSPHTIIAREEKVLWWIRWWFAPAYYKLARKAGK